MFKQALETAGALIEKADPWGKEGERAAVWTIQTLAGSPELLDAAAQWFHEKWGVPLAAYRESMTDSLSGCGVPRWYVALAEGRIAGGLGVIENDFHNRKDLAPNVCAVYVEPAYRRRGLAGQLLGRVCGDMRELGFRKLYLLTGHTGFYERYGWSFLCMVQGDGEPELSRMYVRLL